VRVPGISRASAGGSVRTTHTVDPRSPVSQLTGRPCGGTHTVQGMSTPPDRGLPAYVLSGLVLGLLAGVVLALVLGWSIGLAIGFGMAGGIAVGAVLWLVVRPDKRRR